MDFIRGLHHAGRSFADQILYSKLPCALADRTEIKLDQVKLGD